MYYVEESEVSEYDKHRTYKIRKGDTLQSVARELGVDAQDLRRHHNIYCRIPDLIEADFKSHLELLILPPKKKEAKTNDEAEKKRKNVSFGDDNRIHFSPERTNENYKVQYTSEVGDEVDVTEMYTVIASFQFIMVNVDLIISLPFRCNLFIIYPCCRKGR
jgi:spore germination protein YaaH